MLINLKARNRKDVRAGYLGNSEKPLPYAMCPVIKSTGGTRERSRGAEMEMPQIMMHAWTMQMLGSQNNRRLASLVQT